MTSPSRSRLLLLLALVALPLGAQTGPEQPVSLERFLVKGLPPEQSINPLSREVGSVLGDGRSLLATPRSVSTITTALFNERQIHGVREILLHAAGAYAGSSYGKATVPNLRGDTAETYLNGQRLSYNLYGYFPSFNGVEAVDLVRGPGSAVFGAGHFQGGYVNYVTKQPRFSGPETTVTTRFGTWAPGDQSFLNGSLQIDTTAPVSDRFAWRASVEVKGGDTYFRDHDVRDDRVDLFLAASWRPPGGAALDWVVQYLWQASPEILGVNRPTQELIDHARYYTGTSADTAPFPGPIPATGVVTLPRTATLFSRGDFSNANVLRSQMRYARELSPQVSLHSLALVEHVHRRRFHQFEYAEYVTQDTAEWRNELRVDVEALGAVHRLIAGPVVRYEGRESFTSYFNEYFYNFDLTDPRRVFNQRQQFPASYYPGFVGPGGREFFPGSYDSPETVRSETWNPALFAQQDVRLAPTLTATVGLRQDWFWARARDPLADQAGVPFRDAATVGAFSQAYSLLWQATPRASLYATHNRIRSILGNVTGGGVILNVPDGRINPEDFRNLSELAEAGVKVAALDNQLYASAALFQQDRSRVSIRGRRNNIRVRGLELETVYQPSPRLSVTANATFQDGHYLQSAPFQMGGRSIYAAYPRGRGPGGQGVAVGDFDPYGDQVPVGDWPLLGFSDTILNGQVRYRWDSGFGGMLSLQWQSEQPGNLDRQWVIRDQVLVDAGLFYEARRWSVHLDVLNLTDERNWIHNGDAFTASQLVFAELPVRFEAYVKRRF
ncbi:MAG: TonB-dependent receptor [Verrucomicrobia bacterium]|nr:TonB-dependent receptor [Verrucomicrobiota bacterium]